MTSTLTIGVISDTHDRLHPRVQKLFEGVDEIWHLGDVCSEGILEQLGLICPHVTTVRGNNDGCSKFPLTIKLKREGEVFFLIHIPPAQAPITEGWLLYGHTHFPRDEMVEGVRWFNPGSAGLANKGAPLSVALLQKKDDTPFQAKILRL